MNPRGLFLLLGALGLSLWAGCATTAGDTPEAQIASAIQQYRRESDAFADRRRELVRARLALSQAAQADTARTQVDAARLVAVWRIAHDKERQELYGQVLGATREAGAAVEALEKLLDEQREALAKADTRVVVRGEKLGEAAKALLALGDERSLRVMARRYVAFLMKSHEELKKLEAGPGAGANRPPPN